MHSMNFRGCIATSQGFDEDQMSYITQQSNFTQTRGFILALHFELNERDLRTTICILGFHLNF